MGHGRALGCAVPDGGEPRHNPKVILAVKFRPRHGLEYYFIVHVSKKNCAGPSCLELPTLEIMKLFGHYRVMRK